MNHLDFMPLNQASANCRDISLSCLTYEMLYCLKGSFSVLCAKKIYKCRKNEYIIIPPGTKAELSECQAELFRYSFSMDNDYDGFPFCIKKDNDIFTVKTLLQLMWNEEKIKDGRSAECISAFEKILLARMLDNGNGVSKINSSLPEPLIFASSYIEKHYAENIDIAELFGSTGYSYHLLRHLFKKHFDISPKQYLLKQRLYHACEKLKNTDLPINEIAAECGFESIAYFNTYFKNKYGKTPLEYRTEQKG